MARALRTASLPRRSSLGGNDQRNRDSLSMSPLCWRASQTQATCSGEKVKFLLEPAVVAALWSSVEVFGVCDSLRWGVTTVESSSISVGFSVTLARVQLLAAAAVVAGTPAAVTSSSLAAPESTIVSVISAKSPILVIIAARNRLGQLVSVGNFDRSTCPQQSISVRQLACVQHSEGSTC